MRYATSPEGRGACAPSSADPRVQSVGADEDVCGFGPSTRERGPDASAVMIDVLERAPVTIVPSGSAPASASWISLRCRRRSGAPKRASMSAAPLVASGDPSQR